MPMPVNLASTVVSHLTALSSVANTTLQVCPYQPTGICAIPAAISHGAGAVCELTSYAVSGIYNALAQGVSSGAATVGNLFRFSSLFTQPLTSLGLGSLSAAGQFFTCGSLIGVLLTTVCLVGKYREIEEDTRELVETGKKENNPNALKNAAREYRKRAQRSIFTNNKFALRCACLNVALITCAGAAGLIPLAIAGGISSAFIGTALTCNLGDKILMNRRAQQLENEVEKINTNLKRAMAAPDESLSQNHIYAR